MIVAYLNTKCLNIQHSDLFFKCIQRDILSTKYLCRYKDTQIKLVFYLLLYTSKPGTICECICFRPMMHHFLSESTYTVFVLIMDLLLSLVRLLLLLVT